MKEIKKSILKLGDYAVDQDFSRVKLNQNESPVDVPEDIKKEIFKRLKEVSWNRYPPGTADSLIGKIADYTGFTSSEIIVGNGSNEMIQTLIYAICDTGDQILIIRPGFSIYKRVASVMNIKFIEVPLREDFTFDVDAIIERGRETRLVFLASPNNPTGTALTIEDIKMIAENTRGIVAVDEAYYEFYKESAQGLIDKQENIIVLRTFSKALNLAGIRLGYLLGRAEITSVLLKARLPFSVGIFQQMAGEVILENKSFIEENVERIIKERERLFCELNKIRSICPIPSYTNFILFGTAKISGRNLYEMLYKRGIALRYFDIPSLKNMLRVTIGTPEENEFFLERMKEIERKALS